MQKQIVVLFALVASFAVSTSAHAEAAKKAWTMLVYINGNNNLDSFGAMNLVQMQQMGSSDDLNVVAQWASLDATDTKRVYVHKDPSATTVTSPVVETLPIVDMGKKESLLEFIKWGVDHYPAEHYFIAVWNHGTGWHLRGLNTDFKMTDISYDERSGNHITTEELAQTMKEAAAYIGHNVDVYASDACLMAMVEVAQEMYGAVDTFVGSEEVEPGEGWPYHLFLQRWEKNPHATSAEVGTYLVEAYNEFYLSRGTDGATLSALDMSQIPALTESIGVLKKSLMERTDFSVIKTASEKSSRYASYDYVDLNDVLENLATGLTTSDAAATPIADVQKQIAKTVISAKSTGIKEAGVAIWWPTSKWEYSEYSARYKGLLFDKAAGWSEFLEKLY
jgi:hypothetical protein